MVKKNEKDIMNITKNGSKNWREIVTEIFQKEKKTIWNMEIDVRIRLKKINENLKNMEKAILTNEK